MQVTHRQFLNISRRPLICYEDSTKKKKKRFVEPMHRTATSIPLQITNGISLPLVMSWIVLSHVTLQNEVLGMHLSIF
jgi:hypothetical protein